jgi:hypothetical protein
MRQPPTSPTLGPPIATSRLLIEAAMQFDTPLVEGSLATATEKKIRAGKQPPMPAMAGMMDRHFANGGSIDAPMNFALALMRAVHERAGVAISGMALDDAVAAETCAEGEANRFDMRACVWRTLTTPEKRAYELAAHKDAFASDARARAVSEQIRRDELAQEQARQQLIRTRQNA